MNRTKEVFAAAQPGKPAWTHMDPEQTYRYWHRYKMHNFYKMKSSHFVLGLGGIYLSILGIVKLSLHEIKVVAQVQTDSAVVANQDPVVQGIVKKAYKDAKVKTDQFYTQHNQRSIVWADFLDKDEIISNMLREEKYRELFNSGKKPREVADIVSEDFLQRLRHDVGKAGPQHPGAKH